MCSSDALYEHAFRHYGGLPTDLHSLADLPEPNDPLDKTIWRMCLAYGSLELPDEPNSLRDLLDIALKGLPAKEVPPEGVYVLAKLYGLELPPDFPPGELPLDEAEPVGLFRFGPSGEEDPWSVPQLMDESHAAELRACLEGVESPWLPSRGRV